MYQYKLPAGLPSGSRAAWSRLFLLPYGAGALTPFSYSVLSEVAGRAWFQYYDRLGFEPIPRARILRQHEGRPYFNLTLTAQREAEMAAVEPLALRLDGSLFPIAKLEKGGFLAGIKAGQKARTLGKTLNALLSESEAAIAEARRWQAGVRDFKWTQAEILQIMEEIEPAAAAAFVPFLAARQTILLSINRLMRLANQPPSETLRQIDRGCGAGQGVEADIARRLQRLAARVTPALRAAIDAPGSGQENGAPGRQHGLSEATQAALAEAGLDEDLGAFLLDYGHRAVVIGEIAEARWDEDATPVLRALLAPPPAPPASADEHAASVLLAAVDARERSSAQDAIDALRVAVPLQSRALDAIAYIVAGARRWTQGAAIEAMSDHRIAEREDVFFYELEELKEMMTNEWNISDRQGIQDLASKRKAQHTLWRNAAAPDLFIGDAPAESLDRLEPSPVLDPSTFYAASMRPRVPLASNAAAGEG